jgi:hypothetical protein
MAISKINSKALVDCSVAAVDIEDGSITSAKLAGSIANAKLANSSITVNGNTVSLGASGSIPPVQWQSVVTADGSTTTTAVSGNGYFIDTTSAAHTITLPASPSAGDYVAIKDYAGTFGTNNLTIGRNSENIQGAANDSLISTNRASIVLVYIDSTKGWLYTVESNVSELSISYVAATGGTVTTSGDYKIHTFTGDGCFVVSCAGSPSGSNSVSYLVLAGGAGGSASAGGGGGAGGYREGKVSSDPYSASPLDAGSGLPVSVTTYPVTVGAGGGANPTTGPGSVNAGNNGSNSVFSTITSTGGGGGAGETAGANPAGTGGGGSYQYGSAAGGNNPPVSPPQGQAGGTGAQSNPWVGGGGGGAGGTGGNGDRPLNVGGAGGNGVSSSITGSPVTRAGGGGGSAVPGTGGAGGPGGGGAGGNNSNGTAGTTNTGGGGGAGETNAQYGGAGGKGIVIIRYKYQ